MADLPPRENQNSGGGGVELRNETHEKVQIPRSRWKFDPPSIIYIYIYFIGNRSRPPLQFHHHKEPDGRSVSPHSRIPNGDPCHTDLAYIYTRCPDKFQPTFSFLQKKKNLLTKIKIKNYRTVVLATNRNRTRTSTIRSIKRYSSIFTLSYRDALLSLVHHFQCFFFLFFRVDDELWMKENCCNISGTPCTHNVRSVTAEGSD